MKISVMQSNFQRMLKALPAIQQFRPGLLLLLFLLFITCAFAQNNINVRGRVVDDKNQAVARASVTVKGTNIGTSTDDNGDYQLSAPSNGTLVVSSIGYPTKEIPVNGQTTHNVTMTVSTSDLEQVVVVGYGTQRKKDVTGAVSSVNLEAMKEAPNTNIAQMLQGTVPGLNVGISTISGGTPPITIRGRNTLGGAQNPLIILDGIQYTQSLSSINPDDIATIDILKDASSTAVYGAQAANGVILITSRRGRNGQKPRIAFTSAYSLQRPTSDLRPLNREEYLQNLRDANYNQAYLGPDYTQPNPAFNVASVIDPSMRISPTQLLPNNFDWWDESTNTGRILENNLSISGGGDRFNYLLSGGFVDQKGFIINDKFKRKSIRVNLETRPLTWWKVGIISSGSFVNQDGAEPTIGNVIQASPLHVPFDSTGKLIPSPTNTLVPNPFQTYFVDDRDRNSYLFANIYSDIDFPFLKGLNYRLNFGNNYRTANRAFSSVYGASLQGQAFKNTDQYYDYTLDNILTYTKRFGRHDVTGTLLYGAIERKFDNTSANATQFSRLNLSYNNIQQGTVFTVSSGGFREQLNYQMARVNYKFNDKYLITATARRDGFSGFAENYKAAIFPSVALGWILSEEDFIGNIDAINYLKLRAGYGQSGNQTPRYSSIARVSTTPWTPGASGNTAFPYVFGDGGTTSPAQQVTQLGNPDLKWERTKEVNVGLDFALFNNRFSGTLEYYNRNSSDLLYSVSIPNITGFGSIQTNLGKLHNAGVEASLTYKIFNTRDFQWTSTFNFSRNVNKIKTLTGQDLNKDGKEDDLIGSNLFINNSINTIYDYQLDGIYGLTDTRLPGFTIGSYRFVDQDKSGTITDAADRIILGRKEPAYRMSLYNSFSYKAFTLSFFFNAVQGGKNGYLGNNNPSYFRDDNGIRNNYLNGIDYWSPNNPNGKYPRNISGSRSFAEQTVGNWQDRSFVRLQDASISYNLGASVLKKIKAQSINIYVSGKNLITWTNWEGWDPEIENDATAAFNASAVGGLLGTRPVMRAITFGLNITY